MHVNSSLKRFLVFGLEQELFSRYAYPVYATRTWKDTRRQSSKLVQVLIVVSRIPRTFLLPRGLAVPSRRFEFTLEHVLETSACRKKHSLGVDDGDSIRIEACTSMVPRRARD